MKDIHDIILGPVLTEKSYDQIPMKKYTFKVAPGANKTEIKSAIEEIFGVQVENDPWNTPWLSQTLASCVELLAYRGREGDAAYEKRFYSEVEVAMRLTRPHGVNVGASTEHFGDDSEMTQVLRDQQA